MRMAQPIAPFVDIPRLCGQRMNNKNCLDCGKPIDYRAIRCKSHAQKLCHFKPKYNGRFLTTEGYVMVQLQPDDFFYPMVEKNGYVKEHRLIMAHHLGRCLMSFEVVHHKGTKYPQNSAEDRQDNRQKNLSLEIAGSHVAYHNSHGAYRGSQTMKTYRHLYRGTEND